MLFPNVLVMLSASPRMSGFIYQVCRLPPIQGNALKTRANLWPIQCLVKLDVFSQLQTAAYAINKQSIKYKS